MWLQLSASADGHLSEPRLHCVTWSMYIISGAVLRKSINTSRPKIPHLLLDNGDKLHIGKLEDSIEIIYFENGGKLIPEIVSGRRIKTLLNNKKIILLLLGEACTLSLTVITTPLDCHLSLMSYAFILPVCLLKAFQLTSPDASFKTELSL